MCLLLNAVIWNGFSYLLWSAKNGRSRKSSNFCSHPWGHQLKVKMILQWYNFIKKVNLICNHGDYRLFYWKKFLEAFFAALCVQLWAVSWKSTKLKLSYIFHRHYYLYIIHNTTSDNKIFVSAFMLDHHFLTFNPFWCK